MAKNTQSMHGIRSNHYPVAEWRRFPTTSREHWKKIAWASTRIDLSNKECLDQSDVLRISFDYRASLVALEEQWKDHPFCQRSSSVMMIPLSKRTTLLYSLAGAAEWILRWGGSWDFFDFWGGSDRFFLRFCWEKKVFSAIFFKVGGLKPPPAPPLPPPMLAGIGFLLLLVVCLWLSVRFKVLRN